MSDNRSGNMVILSCFHVFKALDSRTRTTTSSASFSQYYQVGRALEPGSFWRENVIAFIIVLRVLAKTNVVTETSYQNVRSFKSLRTGEGLTSSIKITLNLFWLKKKTIKITITLSAVSNFKDHIQVKSRPLVVSLALLESKVL